MKLHHALHLAINTGYYFWGIIGWSFDEVDSAFGFLRNPHFMTCGWPLPFLYSHGLSLCRCIHRVLFSCFVDTKGIGL